MHWENFWFTSYIICLFNVTFVLNNSHLKHNIRYYIFCFFNNSQYTFYYMHILSYMKLKFSLEPYRELSLKQQKKKQNIQTTKVFSSHMLNFWGNTLHKWIYLVHTCLILASFSFLLKGECAGFTSWMWQPANLCCSVLALSNILQFIDRLLNSGPLHASVGGRSGEKCPGYLASSG